MEPGRVAIGSWSGGRFMHFGEPLSEERHVALLRPGGGIDTVISADAYGQGDADSALGMALRGVPRDSYSLVGAVGHDFYEGSRDGAKGFPRFTDPALRGPEGYGDYLRMATERSLERLGAERFDVLLLHNPDRIGYSSEVVWDGMAALSEQGLADRIGVAPGPANGFTLDLLDCFDRFGDRIDWAMVILNPFEPWPGELVLEAAERHGMKLITRVVDYGGVLWGDVVPGHTFVERDHRTFRPGDWVAAGNAKLAALGPILERTGLTPIQLACLWNLSRPAVECVAPTLIQEVGPGARPIESKREELAAMPAHSPLTDEELAEVRRVGENKGCMPLKGGNPDHEGEERADGWPLDERLYDAAKRWGIEPEHDLVELDSRA